MNRSEDITLLAKAIAAAQGEFPKVTKDSNNPFFKAKYMNLASLIDAAQPVLAKHGIAVIQHLQSDLQERAYTLHITTMLLHNSGQFIESTLSIPVVDVKPQTVGSASTYGRRYALQSILRIAADEDDDGNAASGRPRMEPEAAKAYVERAVKEVVPEKPLTTALRKSVERESSADYQEDEQGYATFTLTRVQTATTKKGAPYRKLYWNGGSAQCFKADQFEEIDSLRPGQRVAVSGVCHNGGFTDFAKVEGAIEPGELVGALVGAKSMPDGPITDEDLPF